MTMKDLLSGVAIAAALAIAGPVWAQNPSGGNPMGMPGPNPGGPGLTPYSGGAPAPASPSAATSEMPAMHHPARHVTHAAAHRRAAAHHKMAPGTESTANQLNQEELARLQSGSTMPPSAPMGAMPPQGPMASPSGGNSVGLPGPNPGGPGLTPYTR
jgi:hypothetical protein